MRIAHRQQRARDRDGIIHRRPLADSPVVDVPTDVVGGNGVDEVRLGWRQPEHSEVGADWDPKVLQDPVLFLDGGVVDGHPRIIDGLVNDTKGIRLGRPREVVDRAGPVLLPGGIELVDGDHLARLRLGQEILVMESPPGSGIAPEALSFVLGIGARTGSDVDDPDFEDIAGRGSPDRNGACADMHPEPFSRAPAK
jgi:hypothetical protein